MTNNEKYKSYCISLGEALDEIVKDAIEKKNQSVNTENENFDTGYLCAFHRIITLMQQQAEVFEISFNELGIDFDEQELI